MKVLPTDNEQRRDLRKGCRNRSASRLKSLALNNTACHLCLYLDIHTAELSRHILDNPGAEEGKGEEDLRWSKLLTVCQSHLGL